MPHPVNINLTTADAAAMLAAWLGRDTPCRVVEPLEGGYCSAVFRLHFDPPPHAAVVKLYHRCEDDPLPRERRRLDFLWQHTRVPCPQVYLQDATGTVIPCSFLLLECLPGVNLDAAHLQPDQCVTVERELAEALLDLHAHTRDTFGEMEEPGVRNWLDLFLPELAENRRDVEGMLPAEILADVDRVLPLAAKALRDFGTPTLIHHDAWSGNIMVHRRDDGWHLSGLLDPVGMYYAEVEMELAYLQVFDTVGRAFFDRYTAERPLHPGFAYRRLFYWLNTHLLHVWLGFGPSFHQRIAETCRQILAFKLEIK